MSFDPANEFQALKDEKAKLQAQLDKLYNDPDDPSQGYKDPINGPQQERLIREQLKANQDAQTAVIAHLRHDRPQSTAMDLGSLPSPAFAAAILAQSFPLHAVFNPGAVDVETEKLSTNAKKHIKQRTGFACAVCGTQPASVAHLLKHPTVCVQAGVEWDKDNPTNFITLCGSDGAKDTCHDMFDKFKMSFMHETGQDNTHWIVVGGGAFHQTRVRLFSSPHRRVVHAHLTHCLLCESLKMPVGGLLPTQEMLSDSPPREGGDAQAETPSDRS